MTLTLAQMASHSHAANASNNGGDQNSPQNNVWSIPGASRGLKMYDPSPGTSPKMNAGAVGAAGNNQPHDNRMPYLTLNFCIALQGVFPQRG